MPVCLQSLFFLSAFLFHYNPLSSQQCGGSSNAQFCWLFWRLMKMINQATNRWVVIMKKKISTPKRAQSHYYFERNVPEPKSITIELQPSIYVYIHFRLLCDVTYRGKLNNFFISHHQSFKFFLFFILLFMFILSFFFVFTWLPILLFPLQFSFVCLLISAINCVNELVHQRYDDENCLVWYWEISRGKLIFTLLRLLFLWFWF